MTLDEISDILQDIKYKDWAFLLYAPSIDNAIYLQVRFIDDGETWKGRKWLISSHMTKSEIVQTALKAVLTAEEHEAREKFLYKSAAIFGPHIDVDRLHELHQDYVMNVLDVRE